MITIKYANGLASWRKLGVAAACSIGCALPAHAGLTATAGVSDGSVASQVVDYGTVTANTAHASADIAGGDAHARASATYGVLKVSSWGSTSKSGSNNGAQAGFSDRITLENAELNGTAGQLTLAYYFNYDANVDATGNGSSNGSLSFLARAGTSYGWFLDYLNTDQPGYTMYEHQDPTGSGRVYGVPRTNYLYVTTDFIWGQSLATSFDIQTSIGAYVPAQGGGTASYDFDAGNSGYWAGIVSATANGQRVTDYLLSSASGTDYSMSFVPTNDVPEPATLSIIFAGLVLLGLQRARKR
jgi:hypothetical protein